VSSQHVKFCFATERNPPSPGWPGDRLRWRKEQMTYRPSSELPERPRAEIETDAHIEGNLATEVSFIILDTLERIVQVKVTVSCIEVLVTIAWLSCPLPPSTALFKMITNLNSLRTGSFKLFKHPLPGFLRILTL